MATRTPKSIMTALVLWLVIIGGIAATVRFFALPQFETSKRSRMARQTGSEGRYAHTVRLGLDSFSGYCVLRSADFSERLGRDGIRLDVADDGADYAGRFKGLTRGSIDLAVFPISSFIQCGEKTGNYPGSIVYIVDETRGADAIVAYTSALGSVSDLNREDARVVLTPNSPSEFLARVMVASFNLPNLPEKTWIVPADGSSEVFKRLRGGSPRTPYAYALWEPEVSRALKDKNIHVLLDSSKLQGFIVDVLVARREFLIESYDVARKIIEAYARSAFAQRTVMEALVAEDAEAQGYTLAQGDASQMVKGIQWKNTLENYAHFQPQSSGGTENIEDMILKIADVLLKTGALSKEPYPDGVNHLYFDRIVDAMKSEGFHPGREVNVLTGVDLGDSGESVRQTAALAALSEREWEQLVPVGELRVKPIIFGRGTARINVKSVQELKALGRALTSWPQYYLTVTGYVGAGGDNEAALALAEARAQATVDALVADGIARERIRSFAKIGAGDAGRSQTVTFDVGQRAY